jgi:hypothetical protein
LSSQDTSRGKSTKKNCKDGAATKAWVQIDIRHWSPLALTHGFLHGFDFPRHTINVWNPLTFSV